MCMLPLFIYSTHPHAHAHARTHTHRYTCTQACSTPTYTIESSYLFTPPSTGGFLIKCFPFLFCFFFRIRWAPWSHLTHSEDLQCRLPSLRCLLARARVEAALFMMRKKNGSKVIGTRQTGAWRTAIKSSPCVFGESLATPLFTGDMKQRVLICQEPAKEASRSGFLCLSSYASCPNVGVKSGSDISLNCFFFVFCFCFFK